MANYFDLTGKNAIIIGGAGGLGQLSSGAKLLNTNMGTLSGGLGQLTTGAKQLDAGIGTLSGGAGQFSDGAKLLAEKMAELSSGTKQLYDGSGELYNGIGTLRSSTTTLIDGVKQLNDGSKQLENGMLQFKQEAVDKIMKVYKEDIKALMDKLSEITKASGEYNNFSGIADGTDGEVKFIYETAAVRKEK